MLQSTTLTRLMPPFFLLLPTAMTSSSSPTQSSSTRSMEATSKSSASKAITTQRGLISSTMQSLSSSTTSSWWAHSGRIHTQSTTSSSTERRIPQMRAFKKILLQPVPQRPGPRAPRMHRVSPLLLTKTLTPTIHCHHTHSDRDLHRTPNLPWLTFQRSLPIPQRILNQKMKMLPLYTIPTPSFSQCCQAFVMSLQTAMMKKIEWNCFRN
mmetsp:Transcript_2672/g.10279  ORF Transcript_2672/g.10279 Transcript_2672/m.10279 type:complete len:210 (-) Transcript_2672:613-1242(-)